jgi:hypothetical protein
LTDPLAVNPRPEIKHHSTIDSSSPSSNKFAIQQAKFSGFNKDNEENKGNILLKLFLEMFYNKVIQEDVENEDKLSKSAISSSVENDLVRKPHRRNTDRLPSLKPSDHFNEMQNAKDLLNMNLDFLSSRMGPLRGNLKILTL